MMPARNIHILGMRVDMVQIPEVIKMMEDWIIHKAYHNYVIISNVDTVMQAKSSLKMREAIDDSSLSVPDGFPLLLSGRLSGFPLRRRVYGPDLMHKFLEYSEKKSYSHFFYGTTEDTLRKLVAAAKDKFPELRIAGTYAPPFSNLTVSESEAIIKMVNDSSASVLWVGIGCPKQELWMHEYSRKLRVPVIVGVGAAFDFFAGTKPQAPPWIRNNGFEWLFRLILEPGRLWRRYLVNNAMFIFGLGLEIIKKISFRLIGAHHTPRK